MGSKYSKILKEYERLENEKSTIIGIQEAQLEREWNTMHKMLIDMRKEIRDAKKRNEMIIKTIRNLWEAIRNQAEWLRIDEIKR